MTEKRPQPYRTSRRTPIRPYQCSHRHQPLQDMMFLIRIALMAVALMAMQPIQAKNENEVFTLDGARGKLAARLQLPELPGTGKVPIVILCHGFMGNMDYALFDAIAAHLVGCGIGVLRFDFNGHGKSEGDFTGMTVLNEIEDAKKVVAWTMQQPYTENVSLLGHSQGEVVAAMTAGQMGYPRIRSLVLMAPAAVLHDDALRGNTMGAVYDPWNAPDSVELFNGLKLGKDFIETARDLPIYEVASRYTGPTLVVHGRKDAIVPYTYGERFAHDLPTAHIRIIEDEDHSFCRHMAEATAAAAGWLKSILH